MLITMCVCQRMSFADLLPLARANQWSLEDIVWETSCGDKCGLCRPYIRRMLETGETVFRDIITE
ncbi:MAG: (2Fe-2S)-binding protein [Gemmatimonadota bacterium]